MDIGVPSGRVIGGRCFVVFTSWLSVCKTHTCTISIHNYRYMGLPVPSSYVFLYDLFNLRRLLYIIQAGPVKNYAQSWLQATYAQSWLQAPAE